MSDRGSASSVPWRAFRGWLKCQRQYHRNPLGDLVVSTTFPFFQSNPGKVVKSDIQSASEQAARKLGFKVIDRPPVRFRRFAGDSAGRLSLDRGRYYTVCKDGSGIDSGTLANELNAYCNPQAVGFALAIDRAGTSSLQPEVQIILKDLAGAPSAGLEQARRQGLLPADAHDVGVIIPYSDPRQRMRPLTPFMEGNNVVKGLLISLGFVLATVSLHVVSATLGGMAQDHCVAIQRADHVPTALDRIFTSIVYCSDRY